MTVVPASVLLREMKGDDLSKLLQLAQETENFGPQAVDIERLDIKRDSIAEFGRVLVAEVGQDLAGYLALRRDSDRVVIDSIIVGREFRHRGIGRALVEKAAEVARLAGVSEIMVETGADMTEAIRFYLDCGFKISGYERYSGEDEGQVYLCKGLQGPNGPEPQMG